jgi:hypothetical protein
MCVLGVCLDVAIDVANETHERENKRYDENARGDDSGGEATDKKSTQNGQTPARARKVLRFFWVLDMVAKSMGIYLFWRQVKNSKIIHARATPRRA